ncbi:type IX secretion system PorP/SprF family membrane protein [Pontibacter ummariensis]|uniref:Type IX secretion system membrane protein, PorP/SprF family n=1 Tax=Pontibacter ummariensis TaxID=1610492 RepID=A0A239CW45_9BACT|nr:type IX secretion system membrane protein PorP/SprF [Pontibacter ummariensis]PRY14830.1 type IX secretion system PorP/SprF family membrane protein [Pontibacter ummariensis]SNS23583.1 type IX secretion system membrane protein, PorP/SprF family [Pontibacter ummariensis]
MKKLLPVLLLMLLWGTYAQGQQQPQFTHYGFNGIQISPAYAGITNRPEFLSIYRYQWLGYDATFDDGGSPQTLFLAAHTPVRLLHGGVGLSLMRDRIANTTVLSAALSYSYHVNIGETGRLGLGVQGNINNIKKGSYRVIDVGDPNVPLNSSDTKFDIGAGIWYESETFYGGGGVTNLLQAEYAFESALYEFPDTTYSGRGILLGENHIYVTAGYHLPLTTDITLTPTVLLKHDTETFSFDVGGRVTYLEKYWAGVNYRYEEAVSALVGVSLLEDNALRVGYALDLTTFQEAAKAATSHEVMLSYRLPEPIIRFKPPVRTPRYYFPR